MKERLRKLLPPLLVLIVRTLAVTIRFRLIDPHNSASKEFKEPLIWIFWHNQILMAAIGLQKFVPQRTGAVLTSPSKDGELLAGVMARFGLSAVRGSSSRRGSTAIRELANVIESGLDVAITPDGPRGPVYKMSPGAVLLSQITKAKIIPTQFRYSSYWELKSWDRFRIPKPFSRIDVVFGELQTDSETEDFEAERLKIETALKSL